MTNVRQLAVLVLAIASCACSSETELARICGTVEAKFQAATKNAPMERKDGIVAAVWQAQAVNPLSNAVASEGCNWNTKGEPRHQLSAIALQYKDEALASAVSAKLTAQGSSLKGSKILTRFRTVSKGRNVLIVFTESVLSEPALATIEQLNPGWIREN